MEMLNSRYEYVVQSSVVGIAQDIDDVLSVQVIPKCQVKGEAKVYTLEELRSLESRLVLIGGNYGKGQQEIKIFVEVRLNFFKPIFASTASNSYFP